MEKKDVLGLIKTGEVTAVDLWFTGLRGTTHSFTISARDFDESAFKRGFAIDGSSVPGFQDIYDSDLVVRPDLGTLFLDPFHDKTVICICDVLDPVTYEPYPKDPRSTAKRAVEYLGKTKIGDTAYFGPEIEFFVFDGLDVELSPLSSGIFIETGYESGSEFADGFPVRTKGGYYTQAPFDKLRDYRAEVVEILESIGIEVEVHHHEVASSGQVEINIRFDDLVTMADKVVKYKYVARNVAKKYGMVAVFLPKPIFGDNGSGMHTHQSLFKAGENLFFDKKGYAGLSKDAHSYIAGLLSNLDALLAISNPTANSYRRLVPHYEAPTAVAFSQRNRSAAVRIPVYDVDNARAKRCELRCPDPLANPYLAFSAMMVFGLAGIKSKLDPGKLGFGPFDENIWEKKGVKQTPRSLFEALDALRADKLLLESKVFSKELLESYIELKESELKESLLFPTPADYHFYGDI